MRPRRPAEGTTEGGRSCSCRYSQSHEKDERFRLGQSRGEAERGGSHHFADKLLLLMGVVVAVETRRRSNDEGMNCPAAPYQHEW